MTDLYRYNKVKKVRSLSCRKHGTNCNRIIFAECKELKKSTGQAGFVSALSVFTTLLIAILSGQANRKKKATAKNVQRSSQIVFKWENKRKIFFYKISGVTKGSTPTYCGNCMYVNGLCCKSSIYLYRF